MSVTYSRRHIQHNHTQGEGIEPETSNIKAFMKITLDHMGITHVIQSFQFNLFRNLPQSIQRAAFNIFVALGSLWLFGPFDPSTHQARGWSGAFGQNIYSLYYRFQCFLPSDSKKLYSRTYNTDKRKTLTDIFICLNFLNLLYKKLHVMYAKHRVNVFKL